MIGRILVAYDDGNQARKALSAAIEIAQNSGAVIYLVSAYTLPVVYPGTVTLDGIYPDNAAIISYLQENNQAHLEEMLAEAAAKVEAQHISVYTQVLEGNPGRAIVDFAEEMEIDLVAVGSHNRTAVNRFFMGSVSNYILQHVKSLVLIAKSE